MQPKVQKKVFAPNPKTVQGYASTFVLSQDGKWLGYCTKSSVVLRNVDDFSDSKLFNKHLNEVTALAFHPDGKMVVSGDSKGTVMFWLIENFLVKNTFKEVFAGKISGLQFNDDGSKLLVYGEGSGRPAKVINPADGKDIGGLDKIAKSILTGSFNCKTNKILVGGEEGYTFLYEADSLAEKGKFTEHQGKFVSSVVVSPDGSQYVSCGFDKKIVTYDANEGKVLDTIDTSKVKDGHKMAILASCFIDEGRFVTASFDRTLKIWNLKEKTLLMTLIPKEGKLDNNYIFCGVQTNGKQIFAVNLNGNIDVWNVEGLADQKLPDLVYDGHQNPVTRVAYAKSANQLFSTDNGGKVLLWADNGTSKLVLNYGKFIDGLAFSFDDSILYICDANGNLMAYDRAELKEKYKVASMGSGLQKLVPSRKNNDELFAVFTNSVVHVKGGKIAKNAKFGYGAKTLDVNEELGEVLIGDNKGKLHTLDMELNEKSTKDVFNIEITYLKLSPDNKYIAITTTSGNLYILDGTSKETLINRFDYHSSKICEVDWTTDSKFLITAGFDNNIMVWDIEGKARIKEYPEFNGAIVNTVQFLNDNKDFVVGGKLCTIEKVTFA